MTTCYHVRFIQWGNAISPNEKHAFKYELPTQSWIDCDCKGWDEKEIEEMLINTLEKNWKYKVDKIYWEPARLWPQY